MNEQMNDNQIKRMVDRFLGWKLPENFNPDGGISFERVRNKNTPWPRKNEPTGTNLLDADQAEAMVRYIIAEPSPEPEAAPEGTPAWMCGLDKHVASTYGGITRAPAPASETQSRPTTHWPGRGE